MIFKLNQHREYGQKLTLWYSYVVDVKMRNTYSYKPIEPVLEMRKIGESYHMVGVAHCVKFSNPDPFLTMDALNNVITLSIESPMLYKHYLIIRKIRNNDC